MCVCVYVEKKRHWISTREESPGTRIQIKSAFYGKRNPRFPPPLPSSPRGTITLRPDLRWGAPTNGEKKEAGVFGSLLCLAKRRSVVVNISRKEGVGLTPDIQKKNPSEEVVREGGGDLSNLNFCKGKLRESKIGKREKGGGRSRTVIHLTTSSLAPQMTCLGKFVWDWKHIHPSAWGRSPSDHIQKWGTGFKYICIYKSVEATGA